MSQINANIIKMIWNITKWYDYHLISSLGLNLFFSKHTRGHSKSSVNKRRFTLHDIKLTHPKLCNICPSLKQLVSLPKNTISILSVKKTTVENGNLVFDRTLQFKLTILSIRFLASNSSASCMLGSSSCHLKSRIKLCIWVRLVSWFGGPWAPSPQ